MCVCVCVPVSVCLYSVSEFLSIQFTMQKFLTLYSNSLIKHKTQLTAAEHRSKESETSIIRLSIMSAM